MVRIITLVACLVFCCSSLFGQRQHDLKPEWYRPVEPFRIAGNLYYVGTEDLACYLITTSEGHILINAALENTVPLIRSNIETLGFKFSDIKILLNSQVHFDHVGGMAEMQKITGAKVMVDEGDAAVLEDGGNSDFLYGGKGRGSLFEPVKADVILHDKDTISLGEMKVVMLHHPGHTKGSCSYLFTVKDEKRSYRVLIANIPYVLPDVKLPHPATYPDIAKDAIRSMDAIKKLHFDIWLCAHGSQFNLGQKRNAGDPYNPAVFMGRKELDAKLDGLKTELMQRMHAKK